MHWFQRSLYPFVLLALSAGAGVFSQAASAAETVVLRYGVLEESIPVAELTQFAETGQPSPTLANLMKLADQKPADVRAALTKPVKVSSVVLDKALNNPLGEAVLDDVGKTVHTPADAANRQALRSALVLSAADDSKLSLLEVIQKYPTSAVEVEGDRLAKTAVKLSDLESSIRKIRDVFNRL